jgi:hypothetical protein
MIIANAIVGVLQLMGWTFGRLNDCNWRLTPIVITSVVLCVMQIRKLYKKGKSFRFSMVLIVPMTVVMMLFASEIHLDFCKKNDSINEKIESVGDFLKSEGLDYGYATFWFSNIITLLTDSEIMIAPIEQYRGDLLILEYQSNDNWYTDNGRDEYFILLTNQEYIEYKEAEHYLVPNEILNHDKFYILVYDYNVIDKLCDIYESEKETMEEGIEEDK